MMEFYALGWFFAFLLAFDLSTTVDKGFENVNDDKFSAFIFSLLIGFFSWAFILFYIIINLSKRHK